MLKPVSILALDDVVAPLAQAVQQRVAAHHGLEDLVQARGAEVEDRQSCLSRQAGLPVFRLEAAIQSIHVQRQRPDSPLRVRDDVGTRELVLVMLSAAGPAARTLLETTRRIRTIYEMRRFASFVSIEVLCLLPEAAGTAKSEDYAAAYALLQTLSAAELKPFDEVWLVDATNGKRVRFGAIDSSLDVYADAIAGALTYEPEMSGALPGLRPRGMHPTFSSFGYASLVFPREVALQRLEARFAAELVREKLLAGTASSRAQLSAKQFVAAEEFSVPLSRIGVEAGESLFRRFRPKTVVGERTRSAEELIAAVRSELQAFRDSTHLRNLEALAKQGEQTAREHAALLARTVDEMLDGEGYAAAIALLDALLDPLPELRPDAELAPRNLVTEIRTATAALDTRLRFTANTFASGAARKRVRELESLIQDQQIVADTHAPAGAAGQLEELQREKDALLRQIPELIFAEETENSVARNAAREAETSRLAAETAAREQELCELFVQLPRAEHGLSEALEVRRAWLWRQLLIGAAGGIAIYLFNAWAALVFMVLFAAAAAFRYATQIVPPVRSARELLARIRSQIEATDQAKNAAHNDELQFEYDITHRRTALRVLRATHDAAKETLDAVRMRRQELETLATSFAPASIVDRGLSLSVVDDADVDAWYERTADDRKPYVREFPIRRSESRRIALEELRQRVVAHASTAFADFRKFTLGTAASSLAGEAKLAQRLKRLVDTSAPLLELRDDDLPAQQSMQRDCTLWLDLQDATWTAQMQRRFPDAHLKPAPDALSVHSVTRVLHYPGYILGQVEHYRAQYDAFPQPELAGVEDLLPADLVVSAPVRAAYEQVLLARALGVSTDALVDAANLSAARLLAGNPAYRRQLEDVLGPRLEITRDVSRELRSLRQTSGLTPLDRDVLDGLLTKYTTLV